MLAPYQQYHDFVRGMSPAVSPNFIMLFAVSRILRCGENHRNWRNEFGQHTLWINIGPIIANDDDDIVVLRSYCVRGYAQEDWNGGMRHALHMLIFT